MRPRSFDRGNDLQSCYPIGSCPGFNEAAIFRSRKRVGRYRLSNGMGRFNEAAIFRSRKQGATGTWEFIPDRFNEAAIFRSRKRRRLLPPAPI